MQFVRETWGREALPRNGSIVKALFRRWPERDVEAMVRGAALLGWQDLRAINSAEGLGRRWAMERYWREANSWKVRMPEIIKQVMREAGNE